jgi:hypothetical protein
LIKLFYHCKRKKCYINFGILNEKLSFQTIDCFDLYLTYIKDKTLFTDRRRNKIKGWAFTFFRDDEDWFAIRVDKNSVVKVLY